MKETLKKLRDNLYPIYGKGESEAIIRIIFHYLKGWNLTDMLIHRDEELSPFIKSEIERILERLKNHEPIQYITGEARFHGMNLMVKPGVLIPRPETDELVDLIIEENKDREDLRVIDLCTGSGCIAIALARNLKFPKVTALDFSPKALEVTKENAANLFAKIDLINADIFKWNTKEKFDIIVSNPPYIDRSEAKNMDENVMEFEPHEALFVEDENPLVFYKRIAELASSMLNPGGKIYLEINPRHAEQLKSLLTDKGFEDIAILNDSFGKKRFITCKFTG